MTQAVTNDSPAPTSAPPASHRDAWAIAIIESAEELSNVALGQPYCAVEVTSGSVPEHHVGSYIALVGKNQAHQLAVLSDESGCSAFAKALLGMSEDEELALADVGDGMCEIANIVAGGVKRRLVQREALELGLPLFVNGTVEARDQVEVLLLKLSLKTTQATIALLSKREAQRA